MRIFALTLFAVCLAAIAFPHSARSQEAAKEGSTANLTTVIKTCPLYPVAEWEEDVYIYFAYDYLVDDEDCSDPTANYIMGNFLWPMTCLDDCPASSAELKSDAGPFRGLKAGVSLLHEMAVADPFDVRWYENKFPAGMARASFRKAPLPEAETFLRFRPEGSATDKCFKCFGIDPATKIPDEKDHFFVALQMTDVDGQKVADSAIPVRDVKQLNGSHAYAVVAGADNRNILLLLTQ